MKTKSPIFEKDGKWWYYDETWSFENGPFETKEAAEEELRRYAEWLDFEDKRIKE